ncbi:unnamed protein product [Brassica napus]|uniref:(rape) hypothetical protein n=1 Tax=Brassica napus TaxID=3708 RepID=A0A816INZ2_BRANA|nr:unnamed protein product [Brassica napus]
MWGHTRMPTLLRSTQTRMTSADSMFHSREDMSYEEYVEIHSRCMRQLGLPVSDSTITCLQVKQMMGKLMMMVIHVGPGNHLGQQTHGFWAKSGLCSNTLNNCFNQEVGDEKSILELEFLI